MSGRKIIEGATEAAAVARGTKPAAAIWHNGHRYVSCPAGFVIMPAEPTEEMIDAASKTAGMREVDSLVGLAFAHGLRLTWADKCEASPLMQAYRAMVAAYAALTASPASERVPADKEKA